jgi:hypothetical protein
MVSARPSSTDASKTYPCVTLPPSGQTPPTDTREAMSSVKKDFPTPGFPPMIVNFPCGMRCGQSHRTFSGATVSNVTSKRFLWGLSCLWLLLLTSPIDGV